MSRTLKSTGIAASLQFLLAVDDNNTLRVFKSQDSNGNDNTSSVNSDKSVHANVTFSTMTWNGHTLPYCTDSTSDDNNWCAFGTNKPYMYPASADVTATYLFVGHTPSSHLAGVTYVAGGDMGGGGVPAMGESTSGIIALRRGDGIVLASSGASAFAANSDETWAFVYTSTSSTTTKFYQGVAGTALNQTPYTGSSPGNWHYGDLTWVGGNSVFLVHFGGVEGGKISLIARVSGEVAAADLAAFHADPYGTLFESAATGNRSLMLLGVGG